MKEKVAVFWIKDGVVLNAMPVNSVAFALSVRKLMPSSCDLKLEELVNFYFDNSGLSTDDKLKALNSKMGHEVVDQSHFQEFAQLFSEYKSKSKPQYNRGIPELIGELKKERDVLNFVTSIADQKVLDDWMDKTKNDNLEIDEALGTRSADFKKGRAHFAYVDEKYNATKMYIVADAPSEIRMGASFGIKTIGYANPTTPEMIVSATKSIEPGEKLDASRLRLPSYEKIKSEMKEAGADAIVKDADGLREYFRKELA